MRLLALFTASAFLLLSAPVHAQSVAAISVVGEASVDVAPDMAQIRAGVVSQGKTAREASEANNKAMAAVMAAIKESGVADKDTQTSRISLQPVYDQNRNPQLRIIGFQASNQVTLKLRDIAQVSATLDRLVTAGANEIGGIELLASNPSRALDEARAAAIADARRKAEIYAKAAGVGLGRPLSISEEGAAPVAPIAMRSVAPGGMAPIAAGTKTLNLSLSVSFELQR